MTERRCVVVGCDSAPDAAWGLCAEHLAEIEEQIEADNAAALEPDVSSTPADGPPVKSTD